MKYDIILATLAFICGIIGTFLAFGLSFTDGVLLYNALIALVSSLFGISGIWIYKKDPNISIVTYIIAAIGVLIGLSSVGIPACVLFILVAIVTFTKRNEAINDNNNTPKDKRLWLIPICFIIILIGFTALGVNAISESQNSQNSILYTENYTITPVPGSQFYGNYYEYNIMFDLISYYNIDYLEMHALFYDSNGTLLGQDISVWNTTDLRAYQPIHVKSQATQREIDRTPAYIDLYFYDTPYNGADKVNALYSQRVRM